MQSVLFCLKSHRSLPAHLIQTNVSEPMLPVPQVSKHLSSITLYLSHAGWTLEKLDRLLSCSWADDNYQCWHWICLQKLARCFEEQPACRSISGGSFDATLWSTDNFGEQRLDDVKSFASNHKHRNLFLVIQELLFNARPSLRSRRFLSGLAWQEAQILQCRLFADNVVLFFAMSISCKAI